MFSKENENLLKTRLTSRIGQHLRKNESPIYVAEPGNTIEYLMFGEAYGAADDIRKYLRETIESRPDSVVDLLAVFADGSVPFLSRQFELISKFVDMEVIMHALREKFGSTLDNPRFDRGLTPDPKTDVAARFWAFYKKRAQQPEGHTEAHPSLSRADASKNDENVI